jgi:hypothetical protein
MLTEDPWRYTFQPPELPGEIVEIIETRSVTGFRDIQSRIGEPWYGPG